MPFNPEDSAQSLGFREQWRVERAVKLPERLLEGYFVKWRERKRLINAPTHYGGGSGF